MANESGKRDRRGTKTKRPRIIDLSAPITDADHEPLPSKITYIDHREGAKMAAQMFGLEPEDFPDDMAWAAERITLSTHSGTHLDAPYHYSPLAEGKPARTIDEVPLEWCYSDGVVLDLTHKGPGEAISVDDLKEALDKIGYTLKPYDIVLIRTDVSKRYDEPGYHETHPGMTREATLWLLDHGIKVTGIDAWGWDRPFKVMAEEFRSGMRGKLWEGHFAGKEREYCHIERLANLDKLPAPFGFKVAVFPVKIARASAGWARAVAILDD